jgi:hypothetical protein
MIVLDADDDGGVGGAETETLLIRLNTRVRNVVVHVLASLNERWEPRESLKRGVKAVPMMIHEGIEDVAGGGVEACDDDRADDPSHVVGIVTFKE